MENVLEQFRKNHGLSYGALALAAGVSSRGSVYCHCQGRRRISAEMAIRYSVRLSIPLYLIRPDLWPPPRDAA
ncbi:XRE family transcriptional regulator [Desulfovibrio sp. DS-1]|nr:XRE family transcriptional regulator [Desulfovibrio sp. DS-1]